MKSIVERMMDISLEVRKRSPCVAYKYATCSFSKMARLQIKTNPNIKLGLYSVVQNRIEVDDPDEIKERQEREY